MCDHSHHTSVRARLSRHFDRELCEEDRERERKDFMTLPSRETTESAVYVTRLGCACRVNRESVQGKHSDGVADLRDRSV